MKGNKKRQTCGQTDSQRERERERETHTHTHREENTHIFVRNFFCAIHRFIHSNRQGARDEGRGRREKEREREGGGGGEGGLYQIIFALSYAFSISWTPYLH